MESEGREVLFQQITNGAKALDCWQKSKLREDLLELREEETAGGIWILDFVWGGVELLLPRYLRPRKTMSR